MNSSLYEELVSVRIILVWINQQIYRKSSVIHMIHISGRKVLCYIKLCKVVKILFLIKVVGLDGKRNVLKIIQSMFLV